MRDLPLPIPRLRSARGSVTRALLLIAAAAPVPAEAIDFAEVDLYGYSVSRTGAPAIFGYDPADPPDLVSHSDTETFLGVHGDHEDAAFTRERLYRADERVNAGHAFGTSGTARGTIEAGHSIAVATGWADAGSNDLGGYAETHAGFLGASQGAGTSTLSIEKKITIGAGTSGLADGTLVTGLRWLLDGHGTLAIGGRSFPNDSAATAGSLIHVLVLRGPTGTCGIFDCPHGALAVAATLDTTLSLVDADPSLPAGVTARIQRHDSWSASNNAGNLKAGAVFESGSETNDLGALVTDEDAALSWVDGVDTGAAPLHLDAIEFEANVGETLTVQMDLDLSAGVGGWGNAESDFLGTFGGQAEDPQSRGLVFASSVPVPEPSASAAAAIAVAALLLRRSRATTPS